MNRDSPPLARARGFARSVLSCAVVQQVQPGLGHVFFLFHLLWLPPRWRQLKLQYKSPCQLGFLSFPQLVSLTFILQKTVSMA